MLDDYMKTSVLLERWNLFGKKSPRLEMNYDQLYLRSVREFLGVLMEMGCLI